MLSRQKHFCQHIGAVEHIYDLEDELFSVRLSTILKQTTITKYSSGSENNSEPAKQYVSVNRPSTSKENFESPESLCAVCNNACDAAHFCRVCFRAVHAICGEADSDDEGYGHPVTCTTCLKK